ncbi:hypothetical protein V502_01865 [Pseudogymnoascus sp. VKM F-4520 (FW-2644)]|nr:hypothetical protein V502_01865 [Pseudogymnoascus sp. VKM F-4520 (FW-2644)]
MVSTTPTSEDSESKLSFVFEAELLSFSIAQSAEIFFERDVSSPGCPPVLAPALISIRAQPSCGERAFYEQQTQSGHPPLVEGSNHNQEISSAQQRRSAPLRGQQPAPPVEFNSLDVSEAELLTFSIAESAEIFFERDVPYPQGPPVLASTLVLIRPESSPARPARRERRTQRGHPSLVEESDSNQAIPSTQRRSAPLGGWQPAAPGPSHHVTPNYQGTSSASHAIDQQDFWTDITQLAQPCFSISSLEDQ